LSGLVVFGDEDQVIGVGCMREIADAIRVGIPVAGLDEECQLCKLAGLALLPAVERTAFGRHGWYRASERCGDFSPLRRCRPPAWATMASREYAGQNAGEHPRRRTEAQVSPRKKLNGPTAAYRRDGEGS